MGHALEFVQADVIARYKRATGFDVFFNTGTDEHGLKIYRMAQEEEVSPQEYVDRNAKIFDEFRHLLTQRITKLFKNQTVTVSHYCPVIN